MTMDNEKTLQGLDWFVLVLTSIIIIWTISSSFIDVYFNEKILFAYSFISEFIIVIWMFKGGANSILWNWLPPFWPLGNILKTEKTRWYLIVFMIIGTFTGFIQYVSQ